MAAVAAETVDQMIAVAAVVFKSIKDKKTISKIVFKYKWSMFITFMRKKKRF